MKNLLNNLLPAFDSVSTTGLTSAVSALTSYIRHSLDRANRTLIVAIIGTTALFSANYANARDWNLPGYMKKAVEARKDVTFDRKVEDLSSGEIINVISKLIDKTNNDDKKIEIYRTMIAIEKKVTNNGFEFANKVKWAYSEIATIQEKHGKVEEAIINYAMTYKLSKGISQNSFDSIDHLMDNPKARAALINYAKTKDKDILKPLAQSYADKIVGEYCSELGEAVVSSVVLSAEKEYCTFMNGKVVYLTKPTKLPEDINKKYEWKGILVGMNANNIKKSVKERSKSYNKKDFLPYKNNFIKKLSKLQYKNNSTEHEIIKGLKKYIKLSQPIPAK